MAGVQHSWHTFESHLNYEHCIIDANLCPASGHNEEKHSVRLFRAAPILLNSAVSDFGEGITTRDESSDGTTTSYLQNKHRV